MRQIVISRPIEIVAGSGLLLMATVQTISNPLLTTELETNTDSEDSTHTILSIIGTTDSEDSTHTILSIIGTSVA